MLVLIFDYASPCMTRYGLLCSNSTLSSLCGLSINPLILSVLYESQVGVSFAAYVSLPSSAHVRAHLDARALTRLPSEITHSRWTQGPRVGHAEIP
jgi:hypothetical protein